MPNYEDAIWHFAYYKQSLGMDVTVCSLDHNHRTPGTIKQIIQDYYDNAETRPDFVLLVGDHPDLPAFSGHSSGDSIDNPITDVPYAFLEGDDYYRDVMIGRWPVTCTMDVQTITNKTIYMEMNMHLCEKNAVFIAGMDENSWNQYYFEQGHEDVIASTFNPHEYSSTQLNQPGQNTALTALNNNPLFYIYSGHGNPYYWAVIPSNSQMSWGINYSFINGSFHRTYPLVFAFACKTGNFAVENNSIAESWINNRNGAVTYFGSSVNTLVLSDYRIERRLFGDAFYEKSTIGGIIEIGMKRFYDYYLTFGDRAKRYMKSYNLMGDPSFMVRGLGCIDAYSVERMNLGVGDIQYYRASENITCEGEIHAGYGSELVLRAGQEIVLKNGFVASSGSNVTARIEECLENRCVSINSNREMSPIGEKNTLPGSVKQVNSLNMNIFPNPASDLLSVQFNNSDGNIVSIKILDMMGRVVMNVGESRLHQTDIDISKIPSGCYYLVIMTNKHKECRSIIKR